VYFEIDTFLPQGNPAWQFLIDKVPRVFQNITGHVLKTVTMQRQISQGLLLTLKALDGTPTEHLTLVPGLEVTEALGVLKYERPIPECLLGIARGYLPSRVPSTDQERIQNLGTELAQWQTEAGTWEITEKLEGESCTFAYVEGEVHVCSRQLSFIDSALSEHWILAHGLDIPNKLKALGRELAFQGEMVGHGIEGNHYDYPKGGRSFFLYDVYDIREGRYLPPEDRVRLARKLDIPHVPVVQANFVLNSQIGMEHLLQMADGQSQLVHKAREGLVFKALSGKASFKTISNKYLLKKKD
jgi:RNA ligase (TIGR02306 family)